VFGRVERPADAPDPAVHHVRRGDHVGAGLCISHRGPLEQRQRPVVVHVHVRRPGADDHAAVPVGGVLTETDVSPAEEPRDLRPERRQRAGHGPARIPRARAFFVLAIGHTKEDHTSHAERRQLARILDQHVHARDEDIGHRLNRATDAFPGANEERCDQVTR